MACVNISGRLYPPDSPVVWNATSGEGDDWSELLGIELSSTSSSITGLESNVSLRSGNKEMAGIVCMLNPEQMLEQWEFNKNSAMIISYSVIFFIGVLGNITAMMGMIGDRKSRNNTTLFLVSLSAADLLLLLVCAPLEALQYFVIQWDEAGTICKTAKYAEVLSAVASVLNLTAVTLERFIVIVFPIRSRSVCTMSNCRRAVLIVWVVSLLLTAPVLFTKGTNPWTFTDGETSITINYCEDKGDGRIFAIYQAVILLLAPGLVMIICYTYVIRELWISNRNMRVLTNTETSTATNPPERRWSSARKSTGSTPARTVVNSSTPLLTASPPTRGHEACLTPCHGPCATRNSAGPVCCGIEQQQSIEPSRSPPSPSHREARLLLGRSPQRQREPLARSRTTIVKKNNRARAEGARNARKQVIKMLILVVVLFLVCWGSRLTMEIWIKVGLDNFSQEIYYLRIAINLLPFVHSCLNPFIYSLMSKNFRRSMLRRVHSVCRCCCYLRRRYCSCSSATRFDLEVSPCHHTNHSSHYQLNDFPRIQNQSSGPVNSPFQMRASAARLNEDGTPTRSSRLRRNRSFVSTVLVVVPSSEVDSTLV